MNILHQYLDPVLNDRKSGSSEILKKLQEALIAMSGNPAVTHKQGWQRKVLGLILQRLGHFALILHFVNALCASNSVESDEAEWIQFIRNYQKRWATKGEGHLQSLKKVEDLDTVRTVLLHSRSGALIDLFGALPYSLHKSWIIYQSISHPAKEGLAQGNRLKDKDWNVIMIEDAVMGKMLTNCDMSLFGCDVLTETTFVNKVGSMPLAAAARLLKVPLYVLADERKLINVRMTDERLLDDILTEYPHDDSELQVAPLSGINYYFEHVPCDWIPYFIFPEKAYMPSELNELLSSVAFHPLFMEIWNEGGE